VTISGSASSDGLPAYAPTVFDRTIVADGAGGAAWYARVAGLPSDVAWQQAYAAEFGVAPLPLADLYYDAATLLLRNLQRVAYLDGGGWLVIDRRALAAAVRATTRLRGVSCEITIAPQSGDRVNDADALDRCAG